MRAVIQRVTEASVSTGQVVTGSVGKGLLVLLGIEDGDSDEDIGWLCGKIARLRIFSDSAGIMNLSVQEAGGDILVVSQFTLHASTRKGNRPSYIRAAKPETAVPLYERFVEQLAKETGKPVQTGIFGAMMMISLINDGPVTLIIDTKTRE
jgi:D-tyrosyl-tRNA(Tyr) deacylase